MNSFHEQLLTAQNECSFCWISQDGTPAVTVVSFVYFDEIIWMTALAGSGRVNAIQRNPATALTISGKGSKVGHSRCVSMKGRCSIEHSSAIRERFFPAFAKAVLAESPKGAAMMATSMNSPENWVLKFEPTKSFPYDSQAMFDQANSL